jgi:hypothetical protein
MAKMGGFFRQLLAGGSSSGRHRLRRGRWRPEVAGLEDRLLLFIPADKIVLFANPSILTSPDGRYVPVTFVGSFQVSSGRPSKTFFYVTDQYGRIEPRGTFPIQKGDEPGRFNFAFTIYLRAQRGSMTSNGRQYDILVGASDKDGTAGKTIAVLVPKNPVHTHGPASTTPARALHAGHARRPR